MPHQSGENYLIPYRDAVQQFGAGFPATLWSSRETQELRFDVIIDLTPLEECVVLDAGCGTGDFAAHLLKREIPFLRYIGIDAVSEMIEAADNRRLPNCEFRIADLIHDQSAMNTIEPDYVCISGTLNTMDEPTARQLVQASFDAARLGVVFNFLSDRPDSEWASRDIGPSRRFNTMNWIDWALSRTSLVSFTQEYLEGHDATIAMRK